MPPELRPYAVRLALDAEQRVHDNLSGVVAQGSALWVIGDEAGGIDRLLPLPPAQEEVLHFGKARHFPLADYLDLPQESHQATLTGMSYADGYLWVVGAHGSRRKAPRREYTTRENLARLTQLSYDTNRYILARIPVVEDAYYQPTLAKYAPDGRFAALLKGKKRSNLLTDLLLNDEHLAPFMELATQDNGFSIAGIAVRGSQVLLGLRGPVLRGWACILEINFSARKEKLRLDGIGEGYYRKHFVRLAGLGIQDLHWEGNDLCLLAAPTMALDGAIRLFRWPDAHSALNQVAFYEQSVLWWDAALCELALPYGVDHDRANAFCVLPEAWGGAKQWLVLYHLPSRARKRVENIVLGDILRT